MPKIYSHNQNTHATAYKTGDRLLRQNDFRSRPVHNLLSSSFQRHSIRAGLSLSKNRSLNGPESIVELAGNLQSAKRLVKFNSAVTN